MAEVKLAYRQARTEIDSLLGLGLPIGAEYFPHRECPMFAKQVDFPDSQNRLNGDVEIGLQGYNTAYVDMRRTDNWLDWVMWALGVTLTAVLAGVGAPFWYDTLTGLARVAKRRSGGEGGGAGQGNSATS